jgi:signal transduction histidine kinase
VTDSLLTERLVERLAALPSLAPVPRAQLEWLVAHGEVKRFDRGEVLYSNASPPPGCYVVLSGRISVRVVRDGMTRTVNEVGAGDISGRLPYSRMPTNWAGAPRALGEFASVADEPTEILLITGSDVREMVRECYEVTALCVHQMVDRTRLFKSDDLQREKMASLGRLAAGLAHELNNPSSAAARSAALMTACRQEVVAATRTLCSAGLTDEQLAIVEALEAKAAAAPAARSPLEDADREDDVCEWLERRGLDPDLADPLAHASIASADLEDLASALPGDKIAAAVRYVAASAMADRLTKEIEHATRRIDLLVSTVRRHTHMDRAPVVDAINLESTLTDTLALAAPKARLKSVSLTLRAEPDLPAVPGVAAQLNDVWMNLVDNAIDYAPAGSRVTVSARRGNDGVVICVVDNGPGIRQEDQARVFEPFFTTKPVGQGAGLGLDVVQRVVRSHGGSVELSSQPGRTELRVSLPLAPLP